MNRERGFWGRVAVLTAGGGAGFWLANVAISLTPVAAEYRAALSIAYLPMLVEALLGGLVVGLGVSYCLLHFFGTIPAKRPMLTSLLLSGVGLVAVTLLIEVPAKFLTPTDDAVRYFLIGTAFNVLRILALGVVVGHLWGRLNAQASAPQTRVPSSGTR